MDNDSGAIRGKYGDDFAPSNQSREVNKEKRLLEMGLRNPTIQRKSNRIEIRFIQGQLGAIRGNQGQLGADRGTTLHRPIRAEK